MQEYVNGHEWLGQQMRQKGLGFVPCDNVVTQWDDSDAAQMLADKFAKLASVSRLNGWIQPLNPLLKTRLVEGLSI